jgi:hypothetical protein
VTLGLFLSCPTFITSGVVNGSSLPMWRRLLLRRMVPALRVGHGGLAGTVLCWGREHDNPIRPTGRHLPDVVAIGSALRGTGPPVERRTAAIGCEHHNPSGRARRSGRHVAAHRAVAIGENVAPKKNAPPKRGESDVG